MTIKALPPRTGGTKRPYSNPTGRKSLANGNRDKAYDAGYASKGEKVSVYSPVARIALVRTVGPCAGCTRRKPLINGHCDDCRALGVNEVQVMHPEQIAVRSAAGRANSRHSPWRLKAKPGGKP